MLSVSFGPPQCDVVLSNWNIAAFAALFVAQAIVLGYSGWTLHAIWPGLGRIPSGSDNIKATSCSTTQCFPVVFGKSVPSAVQSSGPDGEEIPSPFDYFPTRPNWRATSMRRPRTTESLPSRIIHITQDPVPAPTIYMAAKGEKYHTDSGGFVFWSRPKAIETCLHCIRKGQ